MIFLALAGGGDFLAMNNKPNRGSVPFFKAKTKLDIPPELAAEIAHIVVQWSVFENALDVDLTQLRNHKKGRDLAEEKPRQFKRKIQLWRRSIHALYSNIKPYKSMADEISSKGIIVAQMRHHIVHGHWRQEEPGIFIITSGLTGDRKLQQCRFNLTVATNLHRDVRTMAEAAYGFLISRATHGGLGLLKAVPLSSDENLVHPNPPKPEKP
ncbi:MAG: hypothetical protein K2P86_11970 [Xanthobacteraceae bacterium]|nr:hypothetical protein [Xanthobacteraceae bacterium]